MVSWRLKLELAKLLCEQVCRGGCQEQFVVSFWRLSGAAGIRLHSTFTTNNEEGVDPEAKRRVTDVLVHEDRTPRRTHIFLSVAHI